MQSWSNAWLLRPVEGWHTIQELNRKRYNTTNSTSHKLTRVTNFLFRRPPPRSEDKPASGVRPVQSTPVPMVPRQTSSGSSSGNGSSESSLGGFPVNCLQKAGVFVQKIVTTTGNQTVHAVQRSTLSNLLRDIFSYMCLLWGFFF